MQVVLNGPVTARQGEQALGRIVVSEQMELTFRGRRTGANCASPSQHPNPHSAASRISANP